MRVNVKSKTLASAVLLLTSLGITTSCIDSSYDLDKDIDMTINVGGQYLAFPVGSTELVRLDKIIEVKEGDDLTLVDGAYHLIKEGKIEAAQFDLAGVKIAGPTVLIDPISIAPSSEIKNIDISISGTQDVEFDLSGDIKATAKIDGGIKKISELKASDTKLLLQLKLDGTFVYKSIGIHALKVTFPKFLQFKKDPNIVDNVLTLNLTNGELKRGSTYEYPLTLTGYKFEEGLTPTKNHEINIDDNINIEGTAKVSYDNLRAGSLNITPKIVLEDMTVTNVTGIIQPTIAEISSTVELGNLPDFLQDDEVKLNITNPILTFIAENPLPTPIVLTGELYGTAKGGNKIEGSTVVVGVNSTDKEEIVLEGNTKNIIALSRLGKGGPAGAKNIKVSDINNLIKKIPDVINVRLLPTVTDENERTVELKSYSINSSYEIDIPLSFGEGMQIVYKESIDGFRSDLKDIEFTKVAIALTVDNAIPLQLEILENNITPKDVNGKEVDGVKVTVTGVIAESKDGVAAITSSLSIAIEETIEGAMNKMDGIAFKVTAIPGQATNVQLRSDQWLQLKDIKLRVPNGVKVDLDKL